MSDLIINSQNKLYIINNKALALKSYVKDGLVMWLDGIDKGSNGTVWVDKINGYEFTNHGAVFNSDNVYLDGTAYLTGSTTPLFPTTSGTIEVVYKKDSEEGIIIMAPSGNNQLSFGVINTYGIMWSAGTSKPKYSNNIYWGSVSISSERALGNGTTLTQNGSSYLSNNSGKPAYIGKRDYGSGNILKGKIFCIRLYNRPLTEEEVLYNLSIDRQRFDLGEDYIIFTDSGVKNICAATWGDGVGIKMNQAASVTSSQFGTTFRDNTDIISFNELQYFTGLTTISQAAFSGCTSLEEVTFPNTVTSMGNQVFVNAGLKSFTFPESLQNNTTAFAQLFNNCASLTKVYGLENINLNNYCFTGASAMEEVHVSSLEGFCKNTFVQTASPFYASSAETRGLYVNNTLLTHVEIPTTVTSLSPYLFYKNNTITSVTSQSGVSTIGANAFRECTGLTSASFSNTVTSVGDNAFYGCTNLTSVSLPNTVSSIGGSAFQGCSSLTSFTYPPNVTTIYYGTFYDCSSLVTLHMENVTVRGGTGQMQFFRGTNSLANLYLSSVDQLIMLENNTVGNAAGYDECPFKNNNHDNYVYVNGVELRHLVVPSGITEIKTRTFNYMNRLLSITVPEGVTTIHNHVFRGDKSVTTVSLPSTLTYIGTENFRDCNALTTINLPEGLTDISASLFQSCTSLQSITIPSTVTNISSNVFAGDSNLETIAILATTPPTLANVNFIASCNKLTAIYVPAASVDTYKAASVWSTASIANKIQAIS